MQVPDWMHPLFQQAWKIVINLEKYTFMKPSQSISQSFPAVMMIIFDRILENNPYGCILHIKYLVLKSSLKIYFFIPLWFHYSKDTLNYKNNLWPDLGKPTFWAHLPGGIKTTVSLSRNELYVSNLTARKLDSCFM